MMKSLAPPMIGATIRELSYRSTDGLEVFLLWSQGSGRLAVVVADTRTGGTFELAAQPDNALDVFYHPYAYAASQGIGYAAGTPPEPTEALVV
jgi:hypothetical protein